MHTRVIAWIVLILLNLAVLPVTGVAETVQEGLVLGRNGLPIASARVELFRFGTEAVAVASTDRLGRYRFTMDLKPDEQVWVRVWAEGYTTLDRPWGPALTAFRPFQLQDLNGSIQGVVSGQGGAPLVGAEVKLFRDDWGELASAITDANGNYRFPLVPGGTGYHAVIRAAGYAPTKEGPVTVVSGKTESLTTPLVRRHGEVLGEVIDFATGEPLGGVAIAVFRSGLGLITETATDARGHFQLELSALGDREYQLWAVQPGYVPELTGPFSLEAGQFREFTGAERIELRPARGTVAGYVVDKHFNPLYDMSVELERKGVGTVATTKTGTDGAFEFTSVPDAEEAVYRVRVRPMGTQQRWAQSDWQIIRGGDVLTVNLTAEVPDTHLHEHGVVTGRVTDVDGKGISGAIVSLKRVGDSTDASVVTTGSDGRFTLREVPGNLGKDDRDSQGAGYEVRVTKEGYFPSAQVDGIDGYVRVQSGRVTYANVVLVPERTTISGRVTSDGQPVPQAEVLLIAEDGKVRAKNLTDSNGRYLFAGVASIGRYSIRAAAPGYLTAPITTGNPAKSAPLLTPISLVDRVANLELATAVQTVHGRIQSLVPGGEFQRSLMTILVGDKQRQTVEVSADGSFRFEVDRSLGQPYVPALQITGYMPGPVGSDGAVLGPQSLDSAHRFATWGVMPEEALVIGQVPADAHLVEVFREGMGRVEEVSPRGGRYEAMVKVVPGARYSITVTLSDGTRIVPVQDGVPLLTPLAPGWTTVFDFE
jgi:hypothetical protein